MGAIERFLVPGEEISFEAQAEEGRVALTDRRILLLHNGQFKDILNSQVISLELGTKANYYLIQYGMIMITFVVWLFFLTQILDMRYYVLDIVEEVLLILGIVLMGSYFIFRESAILITTPRGTTSLCFKEMDLSEVMPLFVRSVRG